MAHMDLERRAIVAAGMVLFLGAIVWAAYILFVGEGASLWTCLQGGGQRCLAGHEDIAYSSPTLVVALALVLMWVRERLQRPR